MSCSDGPSSDRNQVTLRGERMLLRRPLQSDREPLAAILSEPEVVRWWGPYDPDSALDELDKSFVIVVEDAVAGWLLFDEETWWQYPLVCFDIALATRLHSELTDGAGAAT